VAVASAGPYASLHLAPDRQPHQHPTTQFLQAVCPSCRPTNSVKALKAQNVCQNNQQVKVDRKPVGICLGLSPYTPCTDGRTSRKHHVYGPVNLMNDWMPSSIQSMGQEAGKVFSASHINEHLPSVLWRCWLGGRKGIRPVRNRVMRCWCGYLPGARCRLFAYVPADATAIPKPHRLLPHLNPDRYYLSGTGSLRLSWKRGR